MAGKGFAEERVLSWVFEDIVSRVPVDPGEEGDLGQRHGGEACACDVLCLGGCSVRITLVCGNRLGPSGCYAGGLVPRGPRGTCHAGPGKTNRRVGFVPGSPNPVGSGLGTALRNMGI